VPSVSEPNNKAPPIKNETNVFMFSFPSEISDLDFVLGNEHANQKSVE
jgi:hypothetical protein